MTEPEDDARDDAVPSAAPPTGPSLASAAGTPDGHDRPGVPDPSAEQAGSVQEATTRPVEQAAGATRPRGAALDGVRRPFRVLRTVVHKIHGTRGLLVTAVMLLVLSLIEPFLPPRFPTLLYTVPVAAVLVTALVTLAREGVAVQDRLVYIARRPEAARRLWMHALVPVAIIILLLPRLFLGAYGVPHFTPLAGLILPDMLHRIAVAYLYALLVLVAWTMRRTRRLAPHIRSRPLWEMDAPHRRRRDLLWWLTLALMATWLLALRPFWEPFSLFQWPPSLDSLQGGVRGLASVTYAAVLPAILFVSASAHIHGAVWVWQQPDRDERRAVLGAFLGHAALYVTAAGLHLYNLFWIVRYQAQALF